jgi:DNA-binding MarR family transcriptional regulator
MKEKRNISNQLFRLINKIIFLEKKNIFEYAGVKLFPSEIHILMLFSIDDKQSTSATNIANKLGISKSAVSQTISRLIKKGVITKDKDTYNKNELIISFTSFGEKAFGQYKKKQASNRMNFDYYLNSISEYDRGVINDFLNELEDMLGQLK